MRIQKLLEQSSRKAHPFWVLAAGALILFGAHVTRSGLKRHAMDGASQLRAGLAARHAASSELKEQLALYDLKSRDISAFKQGLSSLTRSKRSMYEAGLALQEEKRLLEKQWEIITTYLMIDEQGQKIHIMRGDQSLESFPFSYAAGQIYGPGTKTPLSVSQIVSKERFAHPERGGYTEKDGQLEWTPPQVGTSIRSNALGQYVMFTRGSLILHGPATKSEEHALYPHFCLGLSLATARKLYNNGFIGMKILFKKGGTP